VYFFCAVNFFGLVCRELKKRKQVPDVVVLILISLGAACLNCHLGMGFVFCLQEITHLSVNMIYISLFPLGSFINSYNSDYHVLKREFANILFLSVPVNFIVNFITGLALLFLLGHHSELTFSQGLMLAPIITSIVKSKGASLRSRP